MKTVIETERLRLREYTPDDFDALYEIVSDPETVFHGKQFPYLFQTYVLHCLFRWPHKYNEKTDSFQ